VMHVLLYRFRKQLKCVRGVMRHEFETRHVSKHVGFAGWPLTRCKKDALC